MKMQQKRATKKQQKVIEEQRKGKTITKFVKIASFILKQEAESILTDS